MGDLLGGGGAALDHKMISPSLLVQSIVQEMCPVMTALLVYLRITQYVHIHVQYIYM
jgi:hypothetical protein